VRKSTVVGADDRDEVLLSDRSVGIVGGGVGEESEEEEEERRSI